MHKHGTLSIGLIGVVTMVLALSGCQGGQNGATSSQIGGKSPEPQQTTPAPSATQASSALSEAEMAKKGELLVKALGCTACHMNPQDPQAKLAPDFRGIYGKQVKLQDGSTVTVDDAYIRESIREPAKKIVAGYTPSMTPYPLRDDQLDQIVAYIRSLANEKPSKAHAAGDGNGAK